MRIFSLVTISTMLTLNPLINWVLEILSLNKDISTKEIYEKLDKQYGIKISTAQLYKTISRLIGDYVVTKKEGKYSLNVLRINKMKIIMNNVEETYFNQKEFSLLNDGEQFFFYATSKIDSEKTRTDINAKIFMETWPCDLYYYDSHAYYLLWMYERFIDAYNMFLQEDHKIYNVLGNNTFLDNYVYQIVWDKRINLKIVEKHDFLKVWYTLRVLWDYIIELVMPNNIGRFFEQIFSKVQKIEDFDSELFYSIFKMKAKYKISVRKSKKDAELLRKKIQSF